MDYVDSLDHTEATGTATAVASASGLGLARVFLTGIGGSFSVAQIGTMRLKAGATDVGVFNVHNARDIQFNPAIRFSPNETASVSLDLGASGTLTNVYMTGQVK